MTASGFFDPRNPSREFANWHEIESELGTVRALALVEHGNALDLFVAALSWVSTPRRRTLYSWDPLFQTLHERGWDSVKRWLQFDCDWEQPECGRNETFGRIAWRD